MASVTQMKVIRHILQPDEPPRVAHWVGFSRVGGEVVMDVAFVEMPELVDQINLAKARAKEQGVPPELELHAKVYARYSLSADSLLRLRENIEHIYNAMLESGDIVLEKEEK